MMLVTLVGQGREAARAGRWDEALEHYETAFARLPRCGSAASAAELARLIGVVHQHLGSLELAREAYGLCLVIATANDLPHEEAAALICIGLVEQHCGQLEEAEESYWRAHAIVERTGDEALGATVEHNLGILANIRGDLDLALRNYRSSLARYRRVGDESKIVRALNNLGMAYVDLDRWKGAARCFNEASRLAERLGDEPMMASIEVNRAELYLRSGRFELAQRSCRIAFEIYTRIRSETGLAEVNKFFGVLHREAGRSELAGTHFAASVGIARRCRDRLLEAEALGEWALVHLADDRNRDALHCLNAAYHIFAEMHARRELHDLDRRLDCFEVRYLDVVRAWAESIEMKDRYTAGHCERVANYTCLLASALGIGGRDLTWLRMAGYLHDVGKIAIPAEVLNKPGSLTDDEWQLMKSHPIQGDAIVAGLDFPWDIRPVVRSHHERWDGTGYPDGLVGEQIPLTARILCLADVYDALTTTRSYRAAMPRAEALRVMEADSGRIFDPELFPIFRAVTEGEASSVDHRFPFFLHATAA